MLSRVFNFWNRPMRIISVYCVNGKNSNGMTRQIKSSISSSITSSSCWNPSLKNFFKDITVLSFSVKMQLLVSRLRINYIECRVTTSRTLKLLESSCKRDGSNSIRKVSGAVLFLTQYKDRNSIYKVLSTS